MITRVKGAKKTPLVMSKTQDYHHKIPGTSKIPLNHHWITV